MRAEHRRSRRIVSVVAGLVIPVAASSSLMAQEAPVLHSATCGWPPPDAAAGPAILTRIEQRIEGGTDYSAQTARDGLVRLRRWIVACDETASREAVLEVQRAHDRTSSDPVLQGALAVALARGIEVQPPGAHGYNYRPAYEQSNAERQARRLFATAIESWPEPELGREFAALALATRDDSTLEMAADALASLTERVPDSPEAWTARAEIAIARGRYDDAREAAANAAGLDDPSGQRALGVVRLLTDDDPAGGAVAYLHGLDSADVHALYRYHEDLAPLLSDAEEREWTALESGARSTWLRDRWEWRASIAARTVAERLAVHFGRIEAADSRYRRLAHRGARPAEALVWDSLQLRLRWDDRGLILLRHGDPDDIVRVPIGINAPGKEAWIYWGLNGSHALFEFQKLKGWADWIAVPPAVCDPFVYMSGVSLAAGRDAWMPEFERSVFDYGASLGTYDPTAAANAFRCFNMVRHGTIVEELPFIRLTEAARRMEARAHINEALSTETATPDFDDFIPALSSVYSFRGDTDNALVAAFLMLPGERLTPRPVYGGAIYPLRLTLAVEDPVAQSVQRRDTLVAYRAVERLTAGQHLRTSIEMVASPVEQATVRITVVNPDHTDEGQILVASRSVPEFPRDAFAMSDLVIAEPGPGTWHRYDMAISPLPGHQAPANGPFRLFYEVYGLDEDETVRTTITIAPTMDENLLARMRSLFGNRSVQELSFDETVAPRPDGVLQVDRTIMPSLEAGRYALRVTVHRPSTGQSIHMETRILLLES